MEARLLELALERRHVLARRAQQRHGAQLWVLDRARHAAHAATTATATTSRLQINPLDQHDP
jgi:hypothetical protein